MMAKNVSCRNATPAIDWPYNICSFLFATIFIFHRKPYPFHSLVGFILLIGLHPSLQNNTSTSAIYMGHRTCFVNFAYVHGSAITWLEEGVG